MESSEKGANSAIGGEQEYETQFLGFAPKSFNDGVYNALIDYMSDSLKTLHQYMLQEHGDIVTKAELKTAWDNIFPKFVKNLNLAFDKLELYLLSNIFYIPPHVILPEDKIQLEHQFSEEEERQVDEEIENLRTCIKQEKVLNIHFSQELKDLEAAQEKFNSSLYKLEAFKKMCYEAAIPAMADADIFLNDNITELLKNMQKLNQEMDLNDIPLTNGKLTMMIDEAKDRFQFNSL